ncbi:PEGA domain-containing protein [Pyxidicoccus caerfyrddinensis]|uniref:PEGA domain-containing protein n=1 Tax=Pyxidicoccus caerfyrddinensis TaxID=2709663 RepID=UPI0013DB6194|nr:PEGA domain-containing protein [Pyxidicoccus caerfyrddinensis]
MNTFRRLALLFALLLAVLPAHAQTTRKKASKKKPAVTKVVKKKKAPSKKKKVPAAEESETAETGEVAPTEPMVFGDPDEKPATPAEHETPVTPLEKPATPAVATPAKPEPTPAVVKPVLEKPALLTASGPVALFAVARTPAAADAAAKLEGELLRHLGTGVELVDLGAAFPPPEPVSLTKADTLFEEGRTAYDNLDPEAAEAKFKAAAEAYTQAPAELSTERLAQAYIFLGASRQLNGDMMGAKEAFTHAAVAEPTARPDSALFSQEVQKAYDEARTAVRGLPSGTLAVDSQPAGAEVRVRGQKLGVTPMRAVEVPAGQHPVVVQLPGYAAYSTYAEVKSSAPTALKAKLEPAPGLAAVRDAAAKAASEQAFDQDVVPAEARAIGERLGARYVVLAAVSRDKKGRAEAELQAWDLKSKARLRGVEIELASREGKHGPTAAADQVRDFVNGALAPRVSERGGGLDTSFLKRPAFWAVVGGVAAVTAGAVFVATQDKGSGWNPVSGGVGF